MKNIYSGTFYILNTLSTFYYTKLGATTEFRAIEGKHIKISQRLCRTRQITIAPLECKHANMQTSGPVFYCFEATSPKYFYFYECIKICPMSFLLTGLVKKKSWVYNSFVLKIE